MDIKEIKITVAAGGRCDVTLTAATPEAVAALLHFVGDVVRPHDEGYDCPPTPTPKKKHRRKRKAAGGGKKKFHVKHKTDPAGEAAEIPAPAEEAAAPVRKNPRVGAVRQDDLRPCGCRPMGKHRRDCPTRTAAVAETPAEAPPDFKAARAADQAELEWECTDCFKRTDERPNKCECGSSTFAQRVKD